MYPKMCSIYSHFRQPPIGSDVRPWSWSWSGLKTIFDDRGLGLDLEVRRLGLGLGLDTLGLGLKQF